MGGADAVPGQLTLDPDTSDGAEAVPDTSARRTEATRADPQVETRRLDPLQDFRDRLQPDRSLAAVGPSGLGSRVETRDAGLSVRGFFVVGLGGLFFVECQGVEGRPARIARRLPNLGVRAALSVDGGGGDVRSEIGLGAGVR